jgi:hypothetical protein
VNDPATKYRLGLTKSGPLSWIANRLEDAVSLMRLSSRKLGCDLHVVRIVLSYHLRTHVKSQISHVAIWESVLLCHPNNGAYSILIVKELIPILANYYWLSGVQFPTDSNRLIHPQPIRSLVGIFLARNDKKGWIEVSIQPSDDELGESATSLISVEIILLPLLLPLHR